MITGTFTFSRELRIKISERPAAVVEVVVDIAVDVIEVKLVEVVAVGKVIAVVVVVGVVNGVVDTKVVVVEITGIAVFSEMYNPMKVKTKDPRQIIISSKIQLVLTYFNARFYRSFLFGESLKF